MPISDRREIAFDAAAMAAVLACSARMVETIGLPAGPTEGIQFDPKAGQVIARYGNESSAPLQPGPLSALLISYCIRAGIKIPRQAERSIHVQQNAVVLVFNWSHPAPPADLARERPKPEDQPRATSGLELQSMAQRRNR